MYKYHASGFLLAVFLFLCMASVEGQEYSNKSNEKSLNMDTLVRYGRLNNGFTYYLRKNDVPVNRIELNMVVKAGFYHQNEDQLGYAHLLEHVLAKETKNFPNLKDKFRGAGRNSSAKTGNAHTWYYVTIPSEDKQLYQDGLQVIRDWARGIHLNQKSIDVERAAVLGEMRTNNPYRNWKSRIIQEKIIKNTAFRPFNLNKEKASIQNFNRDSFLRFYDDWYRPDLQAAIIVGNINLDSTELEIKRLFSDLRVHDKPKNARERVDGQDFELDGKNRFTSVLDSVRPGLRLSVLYKQHNFSYNPHIRADYRSLLLQELYWIMIAEKQNQLEQQNHPPFSDLSLNYGRNQLGGGQILASHMTVDFAYDTLNIKKRFVIALLGWKRMHIGFTDAALNKAKERLLQNYSARNPLSSSALVKRLKDHFVKGTAAPHLEIETKVVSEILGKINLNEMQDYIHKNGAINKNTDFLFFRGKNDNVPDFEKVKEWIREIDTIDVSPIAPLPPPIQSLAQAANLPDKRVTCNFEKNEDVIGVTTVSLRNGIKLVLKSTKPRLDYFGDKISFQAFRPNRIPVSNRKEYLATQVFPEVIKYTGAGPYDKFELERFTEEKDLKIDFRFTKDLQLISGESLQGSLDELFNLLFLYTSRPRMDSVGFKAWKAHKKERLKGFGIRGSSWFIKDEIVGRWFPNIAKMRMQDLEGLTMKEVFSASEEWYSNFRDYTFVITGDFNKTELTPQLVHRLSAFPVWNETSSEKLPKFEFPLKKMNDTLYFNNIDQAFVHLYYPFKTTRDLKTQIELKLLSKALGERIRDRLRDGCYAPVGGGEWLDTSNGIYAFRIHFNSELGNEEKMIKYAREEFRKLKENGVKKEWLEKTMADEVKAFEGRFDSFGYANFWPDYLQSKLNSGEDYVESILQYGTLLEHFTSVEEINTAAKQFLTEENMQQFLSLPKGYNAN